jgi:hypothetical protein
MRTKDGGADIDAGLSPDGKYLLVDGSGTHFVSVFASTAEPSLRVPSSPTPPPAGVTSSAGIALGAAAWRRGDLDRAAGLHQQSLRLHRNDRMGRTFCVEALAWIAASRHQHERAAVLLGAAAGLWQFMGTTLDGNQHVAGYHRDCERQARQALGETAFQAPATAAWTCPPPVSSATPCSSRRTSRRTSRRHRPYPTGRR